MFGKRVAVLMGGKSAEREVSLRSGARVIGALEAQEFSVVTIDPIDSDWLNRLLSAEIDIAFLALHGKGYEDGTIQGVLESFGIPYTGSGILTSAIAMNKIMAKQIIEKGLKGKLEKIYGMEETLYYPNKYAGTADLIAQYNGKICIIDFKQSNKPKKVDFIQDYLLQLGAYTLAHDVVHGTKMNAGIVLLCTKDILFQEFKIEGAELAMYQNLFLGRLKKLNEINNLT